MTAREFAELLHAKEIKRNKEWLALCPAHSDRHSSLSISEGRKHPVVMTCRSHGCKPEDILTALDLRWSDLFYGKATPEIRTRIGYKAQRQALERRLELVMLLQSIDRGKRAYWSAAERRIEAEIQELRPLLEPEKVFQEWRERMFQKRINKYGWDELWRQVYGRM